MNRLLRPGRFLFCPVVIYFTWMALPSPAAVQVVSGGYEFSGTGYTLVISDADGSIVSMSGTGGTIANGGSSGLWSLTTFDGATFDSRGEPDNVTELTATEFLGSPTATFNAQLDGNDLELTYDDSQLGLTVVVTVSDRVDGIDMSAEIAVASGKSLTVLEIELPSQLRFDPADLQRFIAPNHSSDGVGMAFNSTFFNVQTEDNAATWEEVPQADGGLGYRTLYGSGLVFETSEEVTLSFTAEGTSWLGSAVESTWDATDAVVNRPPDSGQWDLLLIDSPKGPYFSGSKLGGGANAGYLMRVGGNVNGQTAVNRSLDVVTAAMDHLAQNPGGRSKVAILFMERGPVIGESWPSEVRIDEWYDRLELALSGTGVEVVYLEDYSEMTAALAGGDYLAVLNPYGENVPASLSGGVTASVQAIRDYVHAGGNWFEVGGHPFFFALQPVLYYEVELPYPPAFADFFQLETSQGLASLFGVQPVLTDPAMPWDTSHLFVPGHLSWGADAQGGYFERSFITYVEPSESWQSPVARLAFGYSAPAALSAYATANGFTRDLSDKISSAPLREQFKQSLLLRALGTATELTAQMSKFPSPAILHFTQYLKGGFDKEYPDHLPVSSSFGTEPEFQAFLSAANSAGLLTMPYTNPTFWGVDPKGPTWTAIGNDDPLLLNPDGSIQYEEYFGEGGFTASPWHPDVRDANSKTIDLFNGDPGNNYPTETSYQVDFFFQDQVGARTWDYDKNPASPESWAYMHGLIALAAEDSDKLPISTENGFDRLINFESQFCGLVWGLVPTPGAPFWRRYLHDRYDPATWTVFPMAQYLAHDKVAMTYNNLGASTANDECVAWALGLGYGMTYFLTDPDDLDDTATRQWLRWIDRVQKSVAARYIGEGLSAFNHQWGANLTTPDRGTIEATYGAVEIVANLDDQNLASGSRTIAPHGFLATAPGLVAATMIEPGGSTPVQYVAEANSSAGLDFWIYAVGGQSVTIELPSGFNGSFILQVESESPAESIISDDVLTATLPVGADPGEAYLWQGTLTTPFTFTTNPDSTVTITGYTGSGGTLSIPAELNGLPVRHIDDFAFDAETSLTGVTLPDSVITIGEYAFYNCSNLASLTLGSGLETIGRSAFQGCTSLTTLTLPDSLLTLGNFAFYGCTGLTSVTFNNQLETIGEGAFQASTGLARLTVPGTVSSIGSYAFSFMGNTFREIYFTGDAPVTGVGLFSNSDQVNVFYMPESSGWTSPWNGRITAPWDPNPFQTGIRNNEFAFDIEGSGDFSVAIETTSDLNNPEWTSLGTLTLDGGTATFSDPDSGSHPARFYRFRLP
jgi:hypothetical protein